MDKKELNIKTISSQEELSSLIERFIHGPDFAHAFKFTDDSLKEQFFSSVGIDCNDFNCKYFYYDKTRNIHISESERGYLWISTMGLVSVYRFINNNIVSAFESQHLVLSLLIEKALSLCNDNSIFDIDSASYECLGQMTTALFHNLLLYLEMFSKAYLTISNVSFPMKHELSVLYPLVKKTMFNLKHNDTLFHAEIIAVFEKFTEFVLEKNHFKEHFVKYNDNKNDYTVVDFTQISKLRDFVDISYDFIGLYFFDKNDVFYLTPGLFARLLSSCRDDKERLRITNSYTFLTFQD